MICTHPDCAGEPTCHDASSTSVNVDHILRNASIPLRATTTNFSGYMLHFSAFSICSAKIVSLLSMYKAEDASHSTLATSILHHVLTDPNVTRTSTPSPATKPPPSFSLVLEPGYEPQLCFVPHHYNNGHVDISIKANGCILRWGCRQDAFPRAVITAEYRVGSLAFPALPQRPSRRG